MQQCSVRVELGSHVLRGREIELVEVTQEVGAHARCALTFDRDARVPGPVSALRLGDLADARVRVVIVGDGDDGTEGFECLAFEGHVRKADATYQATGIARFNVHALSASFVLGEHVDRSYRREHTVAQLVQALGGRVVGALPSGDPRDYVQPGRSAWATLALTAAGEGLQLRPVWPRSPSEPAPEAPAELGAGFSGTTHTLVWGRNLLGFSTSVAPTNSGVTGAFYDPSAKHDHRYVVRARPNWLGGAAPVVNAAQRAADTDANGGEPGHVEVGGPGGTRARTLAEFRARLERESARRLGTSVVATGWSTAPGLRAGDKVDLWASAAAAAGQLDGSGADRGSDATAEGGPGAAEGAEAAAGPGAWVNGPEDADRTGVFGLVQVTHRWNGGLYENQFTATPWADYSPSPAAAATAASLETASHAGSGGTGGGMSLAIVVANADPKHQGRVQVRYPWMSEGTQTGWVRVSAPGAGNGRGLGWLPHVGDEVVVAAVAGDPEHPVVLGALWNGVDRAAHSPGRTHLVTPGGNALTLIEGKAGENKEIVELHTREGKTGVQLSANGGSPVVTVYSDGDISLEAPRGQVRINAKSLLTHVAEAHETQVGGAHTLKATGAVTVESDARVAIKAAGELAVRAGAALRAHAGGAHTITGATVALNPPGATAPAVRASVPAAAASLWGPRPVPGPGPGVSTEDPRSRARRDAPSDPAPKEKDVIDPQWTGASEDGSDPTASASYASATAAQARAPHAAAAHQAPISPRSLDSANLAAIKQLMRHSATARSALGYIEQHHIPLAFANNSGTNFNPETRRITIDRSWSNTEAALALVHEAHHAEMVAAGTTGNPRTQSLHDYLATMFHEESMGDALANRAKRELLDARAGNPDLGADIVFTDAPNQVPYKHAYAAAVDALRKRDPASDSHALEKAGFDAGVKAIEGLHWSGQTIPSGAPNTTYKEYFGLRWKIEQSLMRLGH